MEGRQQTIGLEAKANTIPKEVRKGRSLGKWFPSLKAMKQLHSYFIRKIAERKFILRDLQSYPTSSTCKKDALGALEDYWVLGKEGWELCVFQGHGN